MKTLVVADLHLGTENTDDQKEIAAWLGSTLTQVKPDRLVFLGDMFELILPIEHGPSIDLERKERVLEAIVEKWDPLFAHIRNSDASDVVYIAGEHDYDIKDPSLEEKLKSIFPGKTVRTTTHYYDEESKTLIIHGHEFDYNRIFYKDEKKVSCIDGLTRAIDTFLSQTPEIEGKVRQAVARQIFSYWYAHGGIPAYLETVETIFGADRKFYEQALSEAVRSRETAEWIAQHRSYLIRSAGMAARMFAHSPKLLLALHRPFFKILSKVVNKRIKAILVQQHYSDAPEYCFGRPVQNVVLGHLHLPRMQHFAYGSYYNVPSPRIHVDGMLNDSVRIHRHLSHLVIDGVGVGYTVTTQKKQVPLAQYR